MNKQTIVMLKSIQALGISLDDALALRRISMTLHRWHEAEFGTDYGCIERDEATNKPYWLNSNMRRYRIRDMESGAIKRLAKVMARYPELAAYVQGDPLGASLYIYRRDKLAGMDIESCYSSIGTAVYK